MEAEPVTEFEKQSPLRHSLWGSLRRDGHWKCLSLTLLISGCLAAISWCHVTIFEQNMMPYLEPSLSTSRGPGPCKEGYIYIPVAFVIMLYLVYLVECWHSHTRLELKYKCDISNVYETIHAMQNALPVIWWKATCYHYVRRTRQVMRYRNGDAFTSTQIYFERVDSTRAGAAFNFTQCGVKDISRPLHDLEKYPAIKIKVSKGFSFSNLDTEYEFEEQRAQFFQEYETKDDYMEGREGMDLMGVDFKEYMVAFQDPNRLPWYVSHVVFWLASLTLLSWPLRIIIEYKTAHLHYHIHKLFGSNYITGNDNDPDNSARQMTRVDTMNSDDLEMSIRNNNVVVPSYSEVMLADVRRTRGDYGSIKRSSKFPRSLTNVTLARGSSTTFSRKTPAVPMTKVKKFRSCIAMGNSDSIESSLNSRTAKSQLHQLLRDRGKNNRKRRIMSSFSIPGLHTGSSGFRSSVTSPDDTRMASSFSYHSVRSGRTGSDIDISIATPSRDGEATTTENDSEVLNSISTACNDSREVNNPQNNDVNITEASRPESVRFSIKNVNSQRLVRSKRQSTASLGSVNIQGVEAGPSIANNPSLDYRQISGTSPVASPSHPINTILDSKVTRPHHFPSSSSSLSLSRPRSASSKTVPTSLSDPQPPSFVKRTGVINNPVSPLSPSTPVSPPEYDSAIRMRILTASSVEAPLPSGRTRTAMNDKPRAEIGLGAHPSVLPSSGGRPVTLSAGLRDRKQKRGSGQEQQKQGRSPIDSGGGYFRTERFEKRIKNLNSPSLSLDLHSPDCDSTVIEETEGLLEADNTQEQQDPISESKPFNSFPSQIKLRRLPKVTVPVTVNSDDSDTECLESMGSETAHSNNAQNTNEGCNLNSGLESIHANLDIDGLNGELVERRVDTTQSSRSPRTAINAEPPDGMRQYFYHITTAEPPPLPRPWFTHRGRMETAV